MVADSAGSGAEGIALLMTDNDLYSNASGTANAALAVCLWHEANGGKSAVVLDAKMAGLTKSNLINTLHALQLRFYAPRMYEVELISTSVTQKQTDLLSLY